MSTPADTGGTTSTTGTSSDTDSRTNTVRCANCGKQNRVPTIAQGAPRCGNCSAPLPWIVDAGDDSFGAVAEQATVPVLVDIWAPWCGPCRMVSPALEKLATERAGTLKLVKVNADEAPRLSQRFDVQSIPTLLLLDRGHVLSMQIGAVPVARLRTWVDSALGKEQQ